jgi:hypothetical protein
MGTQQKYNKNDIVYLLGKLQLVGYLPGVADFTYYLPHYGI